VFHGPRRTQADPVGGGDQDQETMIRARGAGASALARAPRCHATPCMHAMPCPMPRHGKVRNASAAAAKGSDLDVWFWQRVKARALVGGVCVCDWIQSQVRYLCSLSPCLPVFLSPCLLVFLSSCLPDLSPWLPGDVLPKCERVPRRFSFHITFNVTPAKRKRKRKRARFRNSELRCWNF
jgi:hypothetical protein